MGIIGYIKRERERRFRLKAIDKIASPSGYTASAVWRFINGEDEALRELPLYRQFLDWRSDGEWLDKRIAVLEEELREITALKRK